MSYNQKDYLDAKKSLDKVINKARVHLYKPIQIAEILYKIRTSGENIDINDLDAYRTKSRKWRDIVSARLVGNISTSSARYQDDVFNNNATPPEVLAILVDYNNKNNGAVEAYIYSKLEETHRVLSDAINYCDNSTKEDFDLEHLLNLFWDVGNLRRSIDKVFEAVVYSLFSTLIDIIKLKIDINYSKEKKPLIIEFEDFTKKVIGIDATKNHFTFKANIHRVGVANAADSGLDMWANFGPVIQIKHLTLTEEMAENIVSGVSADRIVIVCKDAEEKLILSLMSQLGWKNRIQSVIKESDLSKWYEKALRGTYSGELGDNLLRRLSNELHAEFPAAVEVGIFMKERGYEKLSDKLFLG